MDSFELYRFYRSGSGDGSIFQNRITTGETRAMIHHTASSEQVQTLLPAGLGATFFGILTYLQNSTSLGVILLHFLTSLGGAVIIAVIIRVINVKILDKYLPLIPPPPPAPPEPPHPHQTAKKTRRTRKSAVK